MTPGGVTLADLRPGDVMFGPIGGAAGGLVAAGQILVAPWKHQLTWRRWWKVRHCAVVTEAAASGWRPDGGKVFGPRIAQAEPGGFQEIYIGLEHWTPEYTYIRPRWRMIDQGELVATHSVALAVAKVPYAFEDYAAIAAHRAHLPVPHLDRFISRTDSKGLPRRAICSQAVDAALSLSGGLTAAGEVFEDGRVPQDVIPSELYLRLLELGPDTIIVPEDKMITTAHLLGAHSSGGISMRTIRNEGLL